MSFNSHRRVESKTGVDLHASKSAAELLIALEALENMRLGRECPVDSELLLPGAAAGQEVG